MDLVIFSSFFDFCLEILHFSNFFASVSSAVEAGATRFALVATAPKMEWKLRSQWHAFGPEK